MKEYQLVISEQATHDLADIWLYIANDSPQAADKFLDTILEQCRLLCSSPEMGRLREELLPGVRSFPTKRYVIFYRIALSTIEIIRILSGYRDIESIL
ncbi:MAG: type II toxin-antitoxin system RelE/ParE family toxin [Desulfobulbaceae bacterium]|nr:type II toxin-antitoxin system RelE/ParE family toxin [Desulfobulbaceae bacterium]